MHRPAFHPHLRVHVLGPDLLVVVGPDRSRVFEGRILPLLAPHLDGHASRNDLIDRLQGDATPLDVDYGLQLLARESLLVEGAAEAPELSLSSLRELLDLKAVETLGRPARGTVEVRSVGGARAGALADSLRKELAGIRPSTDASHPHRLVLAVTDDPDVQLGDLDTPTDRAATTLIPVLVNVTRVRLGPAIGESGPCPACLERRLRENRATEILARRTAPPLPHTAEPEPGGFLPLASQLVAREIARWLVEPEQSPLRESVWSVDAVASAPSIHAAPTCGCAQPPTTELDTRIDLDREARRDDSDPNGLFERLRPLISGVTGVVDRLEPAPRFADWEAQTWFVEHSFAPAEPRIDDLRESFRHASAGRGTTPERARLAALCEALERYSGLFRGSEGRFEASLRELGDSAIHPNDVMGFSDLQLRERERWNRPRHRYCWVPARLDPDRVLEWSPVFSLSERRVRHLPTAFLYYRYPLAEPERCCFADSNGTAAGGTLEEAILHGLLELVERDAAAIWWYQRVPRPPVPPEELAPTVLALRERYAALGRSLEVIDITNDLGIPACAAVSFLEGSASDRTSSEPSELLVGFGSGLTLEDAAASAVTELHQFLPAAVAGTLRPRFSSPPRPEPFLRPDPEATPPPAPDALTRDLAERPTLSRCLDLLARHELELLVLDQTRGDVGLPVAKTLVPGLRHFWPRFAPGRLYDAPLRLGWLDEPTTEEQLNPVQLLI